jgi:hypothetical protein
MPPMLTRRSLLRRGGILGPLACVGTVGCYPMLSHSTHVERWVVFTMNAGFEMGHQGPRLDSAKHRVFVPFALTGQIAAGIRGRSDSTAAVRLATGMNLLAFAPTIDVYVEAPAAFLGDYDAGIGIGGQSLLMPVVLPYVQFGRRLSDGKSWFVSNAVGVVNNEGRGTWHAIWAPTVAYGWTARGNRSHLFATGIVGGRDPDCWTDVCHGYSPAQRTFLLVGGAFERPLPRRRAAPRPARRAPSR